MWQQEKKDSKIFSLALLLSLVTNPLTVPVFVPIPVVAQSPTDSFLAPQTVKDQTTIKIDGSMSVGAINRSLKQSFEQEVSGTNVELETNGADVAISALLSGNIDIAAIPRGLTPEEEAQGLAQLLIHREKIAIIVSQDNPFQGGLTSEQFANIFRGNITNWSEVGGTDINIRFIDRPVSSATRNTFRTYPGFRGNEFTTGENATLVPEDDTREIIQQLGNDGISYAMVHDVSHLPDVRVIPINETLPDQPNYIYSQPLVYAYKQNPGQSVVNFLQFTQAESGKQAIETALARGKAQTAASSNPDTVVVSDRDRSQEDILSYFQIGKIPLWWLLLPTPVVIAILIWLFRSRLRTDSKKKEPGYTDKPNHKQEESTLSNETSVTATNTIRSVVGETVNHQEPVRNGNLNNYPEMESFDEFPSPGATDAQVSEVVFNGENCQSKHSLEQTAAQHQPEFDLSESLLLSEIPSDKVTNLPGISMDISEEILNMVADAAEPMNHRRVCDQLEETDIFADSETFVEIGIDHEGEGEENPLLNHTLGDSLALDGERSIVLKPRNAQWAYATWYIDQTCQEALSNQGVSQLYLRLYDVTDLDLSYQTPQLLEEYELEWEITEKYLPIPQGEGMGDRNYIAAIGFKVGDEWVTITRSQEVGVSATLPEDTRTAFNLYGYHSSMILKVRNAQWAYATWYIDQTCQEVLSNQGVSQLYLRLYDITDLDLSYQNPQLLEEYELEWEITEKYLPIPQSDRNYIAAIGFKVGEEWVTITSSQEVRVFATPPEDTRTGFNLYGDHSMILKPKNAEWAYATWHIDGQEVLSDNGISRLSLRVYDVTNLDLSYQTPQLIEVYEVEPGVKQKYITIPQSDRDYMAAIGYNIGGDWVTITSSERIRVFGIPLTDTTDKNIQTATTKFLGLPQITNQSSLILQPRTPKWAHATWYICPTDKAILENNSISQLYLRLYDVTGLDLSYQTPGLVQQYECNDITPSRYVGIPFTDHDYIAEIGYITEGQAWTTIVRSEIIRVFSRPQADFWLLTDSELIIHGSTEPGAMVNIAGKPIKVKPDGTFHLRVPFAEDSMNYIITATAANGESQTIDKKFSVENHQ
jgi:phosphate transport system substrate-binding protein